MLHSFSSITPSIQSLIIQIIAAILSYSGAAFSTHIVGFDLPLFWQMSAQGIIACGLSIMLKLPWWWCLIQLVFAPFIVIALALQLPNWLYLVIFIILVFVFWNSADDRVPLYLTNQRTTDKLASLISDIPNVALMDLGSGLGGTTLRIAKKIPTGKFHGVETAPFPLLMSKLRGLVNGAKNVTFSYGNMWDCDLGPYDVVYCFLSPVPMTRLYEKAVLEMASGSLFISNSFMVADVQATEIISVDDGRKTQLYIYKIT